MSDRAVFPVPAGGADGESLFPFLACDGCGHPSVCRRAGACVLAEPVVKRTVNVPARTLQPGDRTADGLVVLRTSPLDKALAIRFEGDDTLWRVHPDSPVQIEVVSRAGR